jgi:fatty-acid desaturase
MRVTMASTIVLTDFRNAMKQLQDDPTNWSILTISVVGLAEDLITSWIDFRVEVKEESLIDL